ncbi:MAG: choline dehydrogenase [Thermodesulfobacteriota bacterium]
MEQKQYDYIIIGGGSAGCALANRLSASPDNRVLVLDAGRPDYIWDLFIHMPAGLTVPLGNKWYDWCYESDPEPFMNNRRIFHGRGKVLGGSSSINGMIYIRGNAMDYQRWSKDKGMENWDYAHCLPYFKRLEDRIAKPDRYHGKQGPLNLEIGPCSNPLFQAFFDAVQEAGFPLTTDVNGFCQEGFAPFDRNIKQGKRWSAARAYYHPVKHRKNLKLIMRAMATRILFNGKRAEGVTFSRGKNRSETAYARHIICCGGAINTPQLLQLSGIANADLLKDLNIPVVQDMPGVGQNLQDHLEVYVQYGCKEPVSMAPALKWYNKPWIGYQWLFHKKGAAASNHFEAGGFIRSNETVAYPNIQFHFLPVAIRYDGTSPCTDHGYQVHIGPMYSDARGEIKIKSKDPFRHPSMQFNYLSTEQDRREWVEAVRITRQIMNQPAFDTFNKAELSPGPAVETDEQILDWVAADGETAYHPSCTCKMGKDEMAVVDPDTMQVHGTEGLYAVDASVMPYITNGNIYSPVMMIAEKAADLILGNTLLKPEFVDYYKHGAGAVSAAPK